MTILFGDFDATTFWEDCDYAAEEYVEDAPDSATIADVESVLGYKIPAPYIELCMTQNGGSPNSTCHRTQSPTSWANDHCEMTGIFAIGKTAECSLAGESGSIFYMEEWGYPHIGIYFADCPSAGHDLLCVDYRNCGPQGEPRVVHVDQEGDFRITHVADTFEAFVRGLEPRSAFRV